MNPASDPYRPLFHFTPSTGWINDPNGLVYFKDEWHLFYQYYNPVEIDGMQWGHAVSTDLIHWNSLVPALKPDALGQIWSGSAVVDHHDTSGLFNGAPGLVCFFTYWNKVDGRQCQGMAYSADGRTFAKYEGNPVIPELRHLPGGHQDDKDFRDPKVFRHQQSGKWVMVVAGGKLRIFSSKDLLHWTFESISNTIETECPDLFEMPLDGGSEATRWVLSLGGRRYCLGSFDGKTFTQESEALVMSRGPDFYAAQSWSDAPGGRRIIISWLFGWGYGCRLDASGITAVFPTGPRAGGCLTLPYELSLSCVNSQIRLRMLPVKEVATAFSPTVDLQDLTVSADVPYHLRTATQTLDITFTIRECTAKRAGIRVAAGQSNCYEAGYDHENNCLFIDRRRSGVQVGRNFADDYISDQIESHNPPGVRILVDRCSIEIFTIDGSMHLSAFILADPGARGFDLFTDSGDAVIGCCTGSAINLLPAGAQ